jgi:hypothetical protein
MVNVNIWIAIINRDPNEMRGQFVKKGARRPPIPRRGLGARRSFAGQLHRSSSPTARCSDFLRILSRQERGRRQEKEKLAPLIRFRPGCRHRRSSEAEEIEELERSADRISQEQVISAASYL